MHVVSPIAGRIGIDGDLLARRRQRLRRQDVRALGSRQLGWDSGGQPARARATIPGHARRARLVNVRFEMYPGTPAAHYDAWGNVGGVHFETAPGSRNLGTITMPVAGPGRRVPPRRRHPVVEPGRHRAGARRGVPDRVRACSPNGVVAYGAFGSAYNRGTTLDGRRRLGRALHDVRHRHGDGQQDRPRSSTSRRAACRRSTSTRSASASTPATTWPADPERPRVRSTRRRRPAFSTRGRSPGSPTVRSARVTAATRRPIRSPAPTRPPTTISRSPALNGIPASGVSAVLLNVTAVGAGAPGPGFMSVIPKPPASVTCSTTRGRTARFRTRRT